ncbi:UDP-glucose 4-epimerase [Peribacillus frigoritolerans]|uniref:NAD-dependent epimerase/dehydratase family protein n=1 Tax=Peribacillus frigoritolerans TaxID=450367 RepID=UPI0039A1C506
MILVVGGAGYIGSHLVKELVKTEEVVILDNLSTGFRSLVDSKATLVEGNLGDEAVLNEIFLKYPIKAVMHFAANSLVGESVQDPYKYYDNNVGATLTLLNTMLKHDVKNFIFSSTAATYGIEIGESHDPETHLIPIILQHLLGQREKISVFGTDYDTEDGTCIRDYIHVTDLAQAHIIALQALLTGKKDTAIYNLGNGKGFSVKDVIDTCEKVTGVKPTVEYADRRPGDPARLVASADKIYEELGWKASINLEEIIESAWKWHKSQMN